MDSGRNAVADARVLSAWGFLVLAAVFSIGAQARQRVSIKKPAQPAREGAPASQAYHFVRPELADTVAVMPWRYRNGKEAALQSAQEGCSHLLLATGFNVLLVKSPTDEMPPPRLQNHAGKKPEPPLQHAMSAGRALLMQDTQNRQAFSFELPALGEMIATGERMGTRYVLAGRAQWRSRYVWIGISNRIKSICTVDMVVLDMQSRQLVLDSHNVLGDSTEQKNLYNTLTSALAQNPLPLVLPGSITPQQQRAVLLAVARAMKPWLKTERIRVALAQADRSGEASRSPLRFSTLVSPLQDLQAHLHVRQTGDKPGAPGNPELARLYALQEVDLNYKTPNKLHLSASSPKGGSETLLYNDEQSAFTTVQHNKVHRQDLADAPQKRVSLWDCCGLLTADLFDRLRARFVRQDVLDGVQTAVYDLTYWGAEEGPFHRIWIDPNTRMLVRREDYGRGDKLQARYLYKQPMQVAPRLWIPTSVEIVNTGQKGMATIQVTELRVNQGISDGLFTLATPSKRAVQAIQ